MGDFQEPFLPHGFERRDGRLWCESVDMQRIADVCGTPTYVYSLGHIRHQLLRLREALVQLSPTVCFAIKANDNGAILSELVNQDCGFDVVSGGELRRALAAGADPAKIVFSGVGKSLAEIQLAVETGIRSINIESVAEAENVIAVAGRHDGPVRVAVRVNPDVDPSTHPKIATGLAESKFGVAWQQAPELYRQLAAADNVLPVGIAFHIGSQLLDTTPVADALARILELVDQLEADGINIEMIDVGGGIGIPYGPGQAEPDLVAYGRQMETLLAGRSIELFLEPGRFLVGNSGALLTTVMYRKAAGSKSLMVVDASMSELLRPALYDASHVVVPVVDGDAAGPVDLVGPVCESTDVLARSVRLPDLRAGDSLAILSCGAYGSVMSSTYNTRPRPTEVIVSGDQFAVSRMRETVQEILARDVRKLAWQS